MQHRRASRARGLIEGEDATELALDILLELEGVQGLKVRLDLLAHFNGQGPGGEQPLIRCGRGFVAAVDCGALALLFEQLDGGHETVLQVEPTIVEVIDGGHGFGVVEPLVAQQLANVGPVLLFNVGVVVFAVFRHGPARGLLALVQPGMQMQFRSSGPRCRSPGEESATAAQLLDLPDDAVGALTRPGSGASR